MALALSPNLLAVSFGSARRYFRAKVPVLGGYLSFRMLAAGTIFWALATIPLWFGSPWSQVSFTSGYGAILITALMVMRILNLERSELEQGLMSQVVSSNSRSARPSSAAAVKPCTTCALFVEFTGGFSDIVPKEEAIYLEHLKREHDLDP